MVTTTGDAEGLRIQGPGLGNANEAYIRFIDQAGTSTGWVGDGNPANTDIYLLSNTGGVRLWTAAGEALTVGAGGNVGIGINPPTTKLDVRGTVRFGSSGEYYAVGGGEGLRIIRGTVFSDGTILMGSGFTVTHTAGSGEYLINFDSDFPVNFWPSVTATATSGPGFVRIATTEGVQDNFARIKVWNASSLGAPADGSFSFIVVGIR
jgi:hypothetical protein